MAIPEGSSYVPGTNRRQVRLSSGEVVSRQTAENIHARMFGAKNAYELKQWSKNPRAQSYLNSILYQRNLKQASKRMSEADFRALTLAVQNTPRDSQHRIIDRSPDSVLAKYLTAIGRRDLGNDWNVGETPSVHN